MKPGELQLGDWVNFLIDIEGGSTDYDPKVAQYQPMQIVSLSSWRYNDGEVESAEGVINDIDQVEPIPLTAEILEKNFDSEKVDFEGHHIGTRYTDHNEFREITIHEYNDGLWEVEIDEVEFSSLPTWKMYVCDVHELQHALRLYGVNKEITV